MIIIMTHREVTIHPRLELVRERFFVHEDVIVVMLVIEHVFQLFHAREDALQIAVPGQDDDGGVDLGRRR